jgi:Domain of unknown function (DUF6456)
VDNTQDILADCTAKARGMLPATGDESGSVRDAAYYLAHTAYGAGIRKLAEASGTHPSTVTRAVQRIESRRDDPLFDRIVAEIEAVQACETKSAVGEPTPIERTAPPLAGDELVRAAKRFLRRLSEPGAFLIIAPGAEKAGIFCAANEHRRPIALLPVTAAVEFLRQDWIRVVSRGSASVRYRITDAGRAFLKRALMEEQETRRPGMAEAQSSFLSQHREMGERLFADAETGEPGSMAVNLGESPIGWLARRKGPDGKPFLTPEEVDAAEKLRADFEAAQIGPSVAQDWRKFLTPSDRYSGTPRSSGPGEGPAAARERVTSALAVLGPGLADVALRACCFLEGLEGCERRLGWSARSGKVVLKLALQRLVEHYGLAPFRDRAPRD